MIDTTDKRTLRKRILDACIKKQQSLIDDFKMRIKAILDTQGLGNGEEYDNNDGSQKGQASEEVSGLNETLSLANEEMSFLQHLKTSENNVHTVVGPGAVVITNKGLFFISVSIEQFDVDGETLIGISTKSPLYLAMKDLPQGSLFQYKAKNYKIIEII